VARWRGGASSVDPASARWPPGRGATLTTGSLGWQAALVAPPSDPLLTTLVPLAFAVVGLLFVVIGARIVQTARRFLRTAHRVPGVVTDLRYSAGSSGSSGIWYPVLGFTTRDGRRVDTTAMYGTNPAPARAGEQVMVLYDPQRPTRAALHGRLGGRLLGSGFVLLGGVLAAVGLVILLAR
jgi:hypothetical protein